MPNAKTCVSIAAAGCIGFLIAFIPQATAYLVINGHLGPHASVGHKMNWAAPHALQVLFSPEHGFFLWTPVALLAIAGLSFLQRKSVAICMLVMVATQIYVGGSVESWTLAGAFGQRRLVALSAIFVIGYAALQYRLQSVTARRALVLVTVLAVYWNLALTGEFATELMDRQRLEPARNAYDAFVTLPQMAPRLIYRYLFDRASFYRGPA
jgi:hypothetical protein